MYAHAIGVRLIFYLGYTKWHRHEVEVKEGNAFIKLSQRVHFKFVRWECADYAL